MSTDNAAQIPLGKGIEDLHRKVTTRSQAEGLRTAATTLASSIMAILIALAICAVLLAITGRNPWDAYGKIFSTLGSSDKLYETLKRATPLILSATAVAVGFKMNLFNIGVEGQYRFGAMMGAALGAMVDLPPVLHVAFILVVAMATGAAWASIAAVLKVSRGVHEVVSTIMLNYIALSVVDWIFQSWFRDRESEGLNVKTKVLPDSGRLPDLVAGRLNSMFLIALVVVFLYWLLVFKSRFGFKLRASGLNAGAARTAGIGSNGMIVTAMLISGGIAGLVALQSVMGESFGYGPQATPEGYGFAGIAVALLGRHHPIGIISAALLFGFLDSTSTELQLADIPSSIVKVIQAIVVLTMVIVNEAAIRRLNRRTAERTAASLTVGGEAS
jgi:ABC-type uncharacterized transport system permease subunit